MAQVKNHPLFTRFLVADSELILLFVDQKFDQVLTTGNHRIQNWSRALDWTVVTPSELVFKHDNAAALYDQYEALHEHVQEWRLHNNEVGLLYLNDELYSLVAPGSRLFLLKNAGKIRTATIMLDQSQTLTPELLADIKRRNLNRLIALTAGVGIERKQPVLEVSVSEQHTALVYRDGKFLEAVGPGVYGYWRLNHSMETRLFDLRTQTIEVSGQEILTRDRVSIRINLTANLRVTDAIQAAQQVDKLSDYLYKAMQLALREAVGTRELDELLEDKLYINQTIRELVASDFANAGVELIRVGVKDIILPGEIRAILNQVVEARKAAEANVIRRREETAATRSLHNTARMMENNPVLLRLKELESLEKVSEKIDRISVYGGLDELMKGTVQIGQS